MERIMCFLSLLLCASSCFVKEDRTSCPGRLALDFSEIDTVVVKCLDVLIADSDGIIFTDMVRADEFHEEYIVDVPRGDIRVNIWSGTEARSVSSQGLVIPFGCECPLLYMHSFVADTRVEVVHKVVRLHKNHCMLTVEMAGVEEVPYSFTLRGNVDGYNFEGLPSSGEFACVTYPVSSGKSSASIPRQTDDSLLLDVDDGTSTLRTFAVGEYLRESGYDWTVEDLEDVTIVIDYYATSIKLVVQGWENEYVYNVIL